MAPKAIRRGYDDEDGRWFAPEAVERLRIAQQEVQWLLDRGYKSSSVVEFVGNHYLLSARQRIALHRSTATSLQIRHRESGRLPLSDASAGCLHIDGFNLVIALEVALSGSVLLLGNDGVLRDLAGLRGTYSIIGQTEKALELIGTTLQALSVPRVIFWLDAPVSNSGRLRRLILDRAETWEIPTEACLVPNADRVLAACDRVVTGDSGILDSCGSWFNLARTIVEEAVPGAWIIRLTEEGGVCT